MTMIQDPPTGVSTCALIVLDPADPRWLDLAASSPLANVFHHPAWSLLVAEWYGYRPFVVAVPNGGNSIRAGLPMIETNSPITGRRWVSLPFTDHCAPLCRDAESLQILTSELARLSEDRHTPDIEVRWPLQPQPGVWTYSSHVLHTLRLDSDIAKIARGFQRTPKRIERVAEQNDVRVVWGESYEHLEAYYRLHLLTRRRLGVPIQPRRFFDLLWQKLISQGMGFVLLAVRNGEYVAGTLFLHWQESLIYKYSALDERAKEFRPNDPVLLAALRWGCDHGLRTFDMGRTDVDDAGLRQFKRRWGTEEIPLAYSRFSDTPVDVGSSRVMGLMRAVIRRSPLWVCRVTGELLYGYFG